MKKIVVVHGVGYQAQGSEKITAFMAKLSSATGAECEPFIWDHPGELPDGPRHSWFFTAVKNFVYEVLMDYTHVILNLEKIVAELPPADLYVGHSAGSVIVSRANVPLVLIGSPVQLVKNVEIQDDNENILNIMHFRDPIAAPVDGAVNTIVYRPYFSSLINFGAAHTSYWTNKTVLKKITEWCNEKVK